MNVQQCINTLVSHLPGSHAVISPGSRNAPVIYALHHSSKSCHSIVDERSAAFVALGMAKHTKQPVILSCTSGTAALNYYPAIAEAFYARVPLIILTADRPPEKIDTWDGQAIRQKGVYKNHILAEFQTPDNYEDTTAFKEIAQRVLKCLDSEIAGPIHINIPIREPFYDFNTEGLEQIVNEVKKSKTFEISAASIAKHTGLDFNLKKVLMFNGMDDGEDIRLASDDNSVILSDLTSNQTSDVHYWDAMLFSAQSKPNGIEFLSVLRPDVLITTGTTAISKGLKRFLQFHKPEHHFHISSYYEVGDMFETKPTIIHPKEIPPVEETENDVDGEREGAYVNAWLNMTREFQDRFSQLEWSTYNEFCVINYVLSKIPKNAILHVSNSMPPRYVSFLLNSDINNITVQCNRGTSGIDGSTSTAVGNAMLAKEDVYLITGDVAFFYDINALYNESLPQNLKIILLNNGAGGIFEMISGPEKMGEALHYQTTPQSRTAENLAEHFGLKYQAADTLGKFAQGIDFLTATEDPMILEVFTSRESNQIFFNQFKNV
ncbi:MAG: 2-succinyl-5-enolpyruvyl-6-hydroxy-3-cyclohexene-1-carboxylate synthase [Bacteroidia bacterium]|jgi:2-succinyl-5-enolpyruvyl-6-hydroxy-3-cyclohexene-1-carboxylate synthase